MKPDLLVSIKIAELYPDNIGFLAIIDEETDKWGGSIIKTHGPNITQEDLDMGNYPTIYSTDNYIWETDRDAILEMRTIVNDILDKIKVMSN